jgi:hypothetical protein
MKIQKGHAMRATPRRPPWALAGSLALAIGLSLASVAAAQEPQAPAAGSPPATPAEADGAALAKKLSNPISDLVSVPFQFNWEQGVGPDDDTRFVLNVQPVMPFTLTKNVNLIARVIVPLVSQPALVEGGAPTFGVSDVLASFFLSPSKPGSFTWGAGPVIGLPSTSEPTLGTGKWSLGPTIVALKQSGPWTVGALWNQVWSVGGDPGRKDVSQMFVQPFVAYQTKSLWTITLQSETTANWQATDEKWTVPVNLVFSKLSSFGPFPASYSFGPGVFAAHPDAGPTWKIRGAITILLPRKK